MENLYKVKEIIMPIKEKIYHTLLEETLIILRNHVNKYVDELDDEDVYTLCVLIRDIEQHI